MRDLVEHLLELPGSVVAAPSLVDFGIADFIVVEFDRHYGRLVRASRPDEERLLLPGGTWVFESVYDDTTDERLRTCINAFESQPVVIWSSVRSVYAGWAVPNAGLTDVGWLKARAEARVQEAGGQVKAGWIEVHATSRVPLGPGSRILTRHFQPMFPLSWKTKGQELAEFHRALRERHFAIDEELLLMDEWGEPVEADGPATMRLPLSIGHAARAEKLWTDGLQGPNSLNDSLLLLNRFLRFERNLSVEEAEEALWDWCLRKNNGFSADMETRPRWVRDKVRRIAHSLEDWMRRHGLAQPFSLQRDVDRNSIEVRPPSFGVEEMKAIVEIADRDLDAEKTRVKTRFGAEERSRVDHKLERFLAGIIATAKIRGRPSRVGFGIDFTMSHIERDQLSSQRKGPEFVQRLARVQLPDTAVPVLSVLRQGKQGEYFTDYRLGVPLEDEGRYPNLDAGLLDVLGVAAIKQRYSKHTVTKVLAAATTCLDQPGGDRELSSITPLQFRPRDHDDSRKRPTWQGPAQGAPGGTPASTRRADVPVWTGGDHAAGDRDLARRAHQLLSRGATSKDYHREHKQQVRTIVRFAWSSGRSLAQTRRMLAGWFWRAPSSSPFRRPRYIRNAWRSATAIYSRQARQARFPPRPLKPVAPEVADRIASTGLEPRDQYDLYVVACMLYRNRIAGANVVEVPRDRLAGHLGRSLSSKTFGRIMQVLSGEAEARGGVRLEEPLIELVDKSTKQAGALYRVLWDLPTPSRTDRFSDLADGWDYIAARQ